MESMDWKALVATEPLALVRMPIGILQRQYYFSTEELYVCPEGMNVLTA